MNKQLNKTINTLSVDCHAKSFHIDVLKIQQSIKEIYEETLPFEDRLQILKDLIELEKPSEYTYKNKDDFTAIDIYAGEDQRPFMTVTQNTWEHK